MPTANTAAPALARNAADEETWLRLRRVLNAARGMFALILVESQLSTDETDAALERLEDELDSLNLSLLTVELSHQKWDALAVLEQELDNSETPPDTVLLLGLGRTPSAPAGSDPKTRPPALARLNLAREAIERRLAVPLIVWCTPAVFSALLHHAPDFFDHFTGIVRFKRPEGPEPALEALPEETIGLNIDAEAPRDPRSTWEAYRHLLKRGTDDPERKRRWILGIAEAAAVRSEASAMEQQEALEVLQDAIVDPPRDVEYRARALLAQGRLLEKLGRRAEGLESLQTAVQFYRALASQEPQTFLPSLASALHNISLTFGDLGLREDALDAARDAVQTYRDLASKRPDGFLGPLSSSLTNLSNSLSEVGRLEEALEAIVEAVEIQRKLAAKRTGSSQADLAASLNNLGNRLSEIGQRADALEAIQEAVSTYRNLALERPGPFLPLLAISLTNLGVTLGGLGRLDDSLSATREAIALYRILARERPDAFASNLATALNNLGVRLSETGRSEEAVAAIQEAIDILRGQARERPSVLLPDLARALGSHGRALLDSGRSDEAAAAFEEGLHRILPFAQRIPPAFKTLSLNLARSLLQAAKEAGKEPDPDLLLQVASLYGEETYSPRRPTRLDPAGLG